MKKAWRVLLVALGTVACLLGVVGIVVPLLPTTPFLYCRSSPRLYDRLLRHRRLGAYIRHFREERALPLRVKVVSVSLVWLTLSYATWVAEAWGAWRWLLLLLALGVSLHILRFPTLRRPRS
mgnify:CR=1 FL=1